MVQYALANSPFAPVPQSFLDPREIFGTALIEFWTVEDKSTLFKTAAGTGGTNVVNDGDLIACWKGKILATAAAATGDAAADPYKVNRIGTRPALACAGSNRSLVGTFSHTFTNLTVILIGRRTGATAFRSIFGLGPDLVTNPSGSPNGLLIDGGSAGSNIRASSNGVSANTATLTLNAPTIVTAKVVQNVVGNVNFSGITNGGLITVNLNGGHHAAYVTNGSRASIAVAKVGIGCRIDDRNGDPWDIHSIYVIDGLPTEKQLQMFNDRYVLPLFGPGVF